MGIIKDFTEKEHAQKLNEAIAKAKSEQTADVTKQQGKGQATEDIQQAQPQETETASPSINEALAERGKEYGDFKTHALLTQTLEQVFYQCMQRYNQAGLKSITNSEKEALHMIFHKIGRIGNGNPNHKDSWIDIAGYAQLVANELSF